MRAKAPFTALYLLAGYFWMIQAGLKALMNQEKTQMDQEADAL